MIFALVGNQNCGKTTLFNQLTGANQHVGNFPGVTVEQKSGSVKKHTDVSVVDLPGVYSLSPYTNEEIITRDFILKGKPDGIINIIDSTNIERNLYLTLQLTELGIPMVLAVNMMDELTASGGGIQIEKFSTELGIPTIPISAAKNEGVGDLITAAIQVVKQQIKPQKIDFCDGAVHRCLHGMAHLIEDHAKQAEIPVRFAAVKLIEGDEPITKILALDENEIETIEHCIHEMETELGTDRLAALADMRYVFIENLCHKAVTKPPESREEIRSTKIDRLLTHKYLGIPVFFGIIFAIFWLTFNVVGLLLSDLLAIGIDGLTSLADNALLAMGINPIIQDLIINGVFAGVGAVLSFLPIIVTLFFFLSLLEDSGYMARVSFIMDKPMRKLGLSGKSFVPLLIGFGCSVPAIMATRTLSGERDRRLTILLIPFMSCSAKLPVYALFAAAFFPNNAALVMMGLYLSGVLLAIIVGLALKNTAFHGNSIPFIMELPNYRLPSPKNVWLLLWDKAKDFLQRAFTVIFVASIVIWFLQTFNFRLNIADAPNESILSALGGIIAVILKPLGFGDWRAATALVSGFMAKEAVVGTLGVLTGQSSDNLAGGLSMMFTPLSAASFLVFTLLYTPCIAAVAAVKRELGNVWTMGIVLFQLAFAWVCAFLVYQTGKLFLLNIDINIKDIVLVAVIVFGIVISIRRILKSKSGCHGHCEKCEHCTK